MLLEGDVECEVVCLFVDVGLGEAFEDGLFFFQQVEAFLVEVDGGEIAVGEDVLGGYGLFEVASGDGCGIADAGPVEGNGLVLGREVVAAYDAFGGLDLGGELSAVGDCVVIAPAAVEGGGVEVVAEADDLGFVGGLYHLGVEAEGEHLVLIIF